MTLKESIVQEMWARGYRPPFHVEITLADGDTIEFDVEEVDEEWLSESDRH